VVSVSADASCAFDQADVRSLEAAVLQAQPLPYAGFESVFRRMLLLNFKAGADPAAK
jgi:colicin import membrane protein